MARFYKPRFNKLFLFATIAFFGVSGSMQQSAEAPFSLSYAPIVSAHAAQDVTFDNLSFIVGPVKIKINTIRIVGSTFDKTAIETLFSEKDPAKLQELLTTFSATSISIPSIEVTASPKYWKDKPDFKNDFDLIWTNSGIEMQSIVNGRIASVTVSSGTGKGFFKDGEESNAQPISFKGDTKRQVMADFDLPLAVRFLMTTADSSKTSLQPLFRDLVLDGMTLTAEGLDTKAKKPFKMDLSYGRVSVPVYKVRPFESRAYLDLFSPAFFKEIENIDKAETPEKGFRLFAGLYADILSSTSQNFEATDLQANVLVTTDNTKPFQVAIKRVYTKDTNGMIDLGFEGVDARLQSTETDQSNQGFCFKLGSYGLHGWSYQPTAERLRIIAKTPNLLEEYSQPAKLMGMIPTIGTWSLNDLNVSDCTGGAPTTLVSIKGAEIAVTEQTNGIPSSMKTVINNLFVAEKLFADSDPAQYLNLKELKLSALFDYAWNKNTQDLTVNHNATVDGLGTVKASASAGNISELLFSGDETATLALIGATVKAVALEVEDKGGVDRVMTVAAQESDVSPEQFKTQIISMVRPMIEMMTEGREEGTMLAKSVETFLKTPGRLAIAIKSKKSNGLGMADFAAAQNAPSILFNKVDMTVTNQ